MSGRGPANTPAGSADRRDVAMTALENTGLVLGVQMSMAMEQVFKQLAEQMTAAVAGAIAAAIGAPAHAAKALPPEVVAARTGLAEAVARMRQGMTMDTARRDAAAANLTDQHAEAIVRGAAEHLAGLPPMTGPLSDAQCADYLALAITEDPRWAAWMGVVMPIMQTITRGQ